MTVAYLLQKILQELQHSFITVRFEVADTINTKEGIECSGFFDQEINTLAVAIEDDGWFLVLLHEYCHFKQWQEGLWSSEAHIALETGRDKWVLGQQEMTDYDVLKATRSIQECELDCEKRVVAMIQEHNLSVDTQEYTRLSNAYVLSFEVERLQRKVLHNGSSQGAPFMPNIFITDFSTFPSGYKEAVLFNDLVERPVLDEELPIVIGQYIDIDISDMYARIPG